MKTSLPANLTEDIKNVIYVFFRAKRKLVEISWSSLLLGSNSAFLKAAQCKQKGPHRIRTKKTARKAKKKKRNPLIKPASCLQFHLRDNPSRACSHQSLGRPDTLAPAWCCVSRCHLLRRDIPSAARDVVKTESKGKRQQNWPRKISDRKAVPEKYKPILYMIFSTLCKSKRRGDVGDVTKTIPMTQPPRIALRTRQWTWNHSLRWQSLSLSVHLSSWYQWQRTASRKDTEWNSFLFILPNSQHIPYAQLISSPSLTCLPATAFSGHFPLFGLTQHPCLNSSSFYQQFYVTGWAKLLLFWIH